jgi:dihydrofolate reductase
MRKLKVQMNISLDNKWDSGMSNFSIDNLKDVDCILHGRKTGEGFIPYWAEVANNPNDGEYKLGKRFSEIPNVIFSNTLVVSKQEIEVLKNKKGKEIIVYGGDSFVSSLIQHDLIDELYLLINPAVIGGGQQTFNPLRNDLKLKLAKCNPFESGAILLCYTR